MLNRFLRVILWGITLFLLLLAILVTGLRVALPHMNRYQNEITAWVNHQTQANFSIENVQGYWRNTHPSISLQGLQAHKLDGEQLNLEAKSVDIEFDLIRSLIRRQLVVADLTIHKLGLDASAIRLASDDVQSDPSLNDSQDSASLIRTLDRIFLRQLDYFSVIDSEVVYQSVTGEVHTLAIEKLKWQNIGENHRAEGLVSIVGTGVNSLHVGANFQDFGSLTDLSGQFYLQANQIELGPWLSDYLRKDMGITGGELSFDAWVDLNHSEPASGYLSFRPSQVSWGNEHHLSLTSGIIESAARQQDNQQVWYINTYSFALSTDEQNWPGLDVSASWSKQGWSADIAQSDIGALIPFSEILPDAQEVKAWISGLNPDGQIRDLRIAADKDSPIQYSANVDELSTSQWKLLPEVHHLNAHITGNGKRAVIHAQLTDDQLPYGDVFQAPLEIQDGRVTLVWQKEDAGWSLWSDHISVSTPHLSALGEFRLDFPQQKSPRLAIYAEASLRDAGESWRYLPTRALGQHLTDYLSAALQGGQADNAQILWYGDLHDFPYRSHSGMFQAYVPLDKGKFSFDTNWPAIDDLQLDLLFENESLNFESHSARLMDVKAQYIKGEIPRLVNHGHLDIQATASGDGMAIRDYMTASPLVDSVGAALTTVQINGNVNANFNLHIPFDLQNEQVRAWGKAKLNKNRVEIQAPPMTISQLSGDITFDNDRISAKFLTGMMLDQRASFAFSGKSNQKGYQVHVGSSGTWDVTRLGPHVGRYWTNPLKGTAPWDMGVDIQLNDVGFAYQVNLKGNLARIASHYPYPLDKQIGEAGEFTVQASGNQRMISARAELPGAKYQAEIDITPSVPVLTATNLVVGNGSFKPSPIKGHQVVIRTDKFSLDDWIPVIFSDQAKGQAGKQSGFPEIPEPEHVVLDVPTLTAGALEWHDANLVARKNNVGWRVDINVQEAQGEASYIDPYDLSVSLKQLHLYVPQLESEESGEQAVSAPEASATQAITEFDRDFHQLMPNLTLYIEDFWFQGYKVGQMNMDFQRQGDALVWKRIDITSGTNEVHANGRWLLKGNRSHTYLGMNIKGDNNSDLMERFGITSGIQKAPFNLSGNLEWEGAPWSVETETLNGRVDAKLGKGVVSDVSGAAKLLGLFSLDSIIRKMQLDFSDIFDSGMAFDSIKGSGEITDGIFVTNNLSMDAMAGDMTIKGLVDLNQRLIDSEVSFVPDITSGIPVLSAFAVTPVTALYVLAVTTVISPVVEVFTEVNYSVKGPIDSPAVKEISRSKGEFTLPEKMLKQVENQGAAK